jgi:hypothetical protein
VGTLLPEPCPQFFFALSYFSSRGFDFANFLPRLDSNCHLPDLYVHKIKICFFPVCGGGGLWEQRGDVSKCKNVKKNLLLERVIGKSSTIYFSFSYS